MAPQTYFFHLHTIPFPKVALVCDGGSVHKGARVSWAETGTPFLGFSTSPYSSFWACDSLSSLRSRAVPLIWAQKRREALLVYTAQTMNLQFRRRHASPFVPKASKKRAQMVIPDAVTVETGKYSYEVESAINQLSSLPPRASFARSMDSYKNKLSMKDFALIFREFAQRGDWQRALRLFKYMQRQVWCKPNEHIHTILIGILGREGHLDKCTEVFEEMPSYNVEWSVYSFTALINAYGRNGQYEASLHLLERMKKERINPNLITYNTVINACAKGGLEWEGLLSLFAQMRHEGIQPDVITYNTLLSACSSRALVEEAKMVFRTMNEAGVVPDAVTYTSLVETCGGAGRLEAVKELLREMESAGNIPDVQAYNVLLDAYGKRGDISGATEIFTQMLQAGCNPNVATYSTLLECYGKNGCFDDVRALFSEMKASGTTPDLTTYKTLIKLFGRGGFFREAISLFGDMVDGNVMPDMEIYKDLIHACGLGGLYRRAEEIFQHLLQQGLTPEPEIFQGLIDAYGMASLYQEAAVAFNCIEELGCKPNRDTFNALIHAYSVGGLYKEAATVFIRMREAGFWQNVHTFNSLIEAYGRAGLFDEATEVFFDMHEAKCPANLATYVALLNVCCMVGLVDEAKSHFLKMEPDATACCLMFSICARQSRWDDAYKVLEDMQARNMYDLHVLAAGLIQGHFDDDVNWEQVVEPALENIRVDGLGMNMMFYNALLEALWCSGQRLRAVRVFQEGRKRGIFAEAFHETKALDSLDVHRMSIGAAGSALFVWLDKLQSSSHVAEEFPKFFTIITRKSEIDEGDEPDTPVARAVYSILEEMGAPFKSAPWNRRCIVSFKKILVPWLETSFLSETFLINHQLPSPDTIMTSNFYSVKKDSSRRQLTAVQ